LPAPPSATIAPDSPESTPAVPDVKCVVWDLDNTFWRGVYLENDELVVQEDVRRAVLTLDERGILQSIASRNPAEVLSRLAETGLAEYFLYPQAGWGEKTESIVRIAEQLRLSLDSFLFIDDDRLEIAAMLHAHPQVRCCPASEIPRLLERADLNPAVVTADARNRSSCARWG
jgi:FkbH-like protein